MPRYTKIRAEAHERIVLGKKKQITLGEALQRFIQTKAGTPKAGAARGYSSVAIRKAFSRAGGVKAARMLLSSEDHFKSGFRYLKENNMLDHSIEAFVVKFADSGLFDPDEIETARWRIENAPAADNEDADEGAEEQADDESE